MMQRLTNVIGPLIFASIPLIGHFAFNWDFFSIFAAFLIESAAIVVVFNIDRYFFSPATKYPVFFAMIQLLFFVSMYGAFLYIYMLLAYIFCDYYIPEDETAAEMMLERVKGMDLHYLFGIAFLVEALLLIGRIRLQKHFRLYNFRRTMNKMLYLHLFLMGTLFLFAFIFPMEGAAIFVLLGLKLIVDFASEYQAKKAIDQSMALGTIEAEEAEHRVNATDHD